MASFLSSLLILSLVIPNASPSSNDIIKSLCSRTDYPKLCISTIQSQLFNISEPLHPATVLKLAIRAVRSKSKDAKQVASALYHNTTNKAEISPLKDCAEMYDDVEYSLDIADQAIRTRDKGTIGSMLSSVGTDVETCDEGFDEMKLPNLMKKYDSLLAKLAEICLAIAQAASLL